MKMTNTLLDLQRFLMQKGIIFGVHPSISDLISFLQKKRVERKLIRLMYGETYDAFGITIDSLKYYLFLSHLHKVLESEGFLVESTILVADSASVLNKSIHNKAELLQNGQTRISRIEKIIRTYKLAIRPILMSDLFKNIQLQTTIENVGTYSQKNKMVQSLFEKTVLQNRITQERQTGFRYAVEGVATALQFDIKIGPPREQYYDKAAKIIGRELGLGSIYGIYLKPTYPLGKDFSFFISNPEIEEFGLTPYKAGSNKLQEFRIFLETNDIEKIKELIDSSFLSTNLSLANPVVDLHFITDLAEGALKHTNILPSYRKDFLKDESFYKQQTYKRIQDFVLKPLQKGGFYD